MRFLLFALILRANACIAPAIHPANGQRAYAACAAARTCAECAGLAPTQGCGYCQGACVPPQADGGPATGCASDWVQLSESCPTLPSLVTR